MVFHWSLSDSKSPQVSRTLLSILAVFNNAVVWMVSTRPPTSKSSRPFNNPLVTVPNAPISIGIIVSCMFHSFFTSLARSRYLSFFSDSFRCILWSAGTAKSTILPVFFFFFFFFFLLIIIKSGLLVEIRWSVCMSKSHSLCVSFSRTGAGLCIYHLFVWSDFINIIIITLAYVRIFPKVKGLSNDIKSPFYAEFKNTAHCVWSGLIFKICLNTLQQLVHNNHPYSKACGLYFSQIIVNAWYLTTVYHPIRYHPHIQRGRDWSLSLKWC